MDVDGFNQFGRDLFIDRRQTRQTRGYVDQVAAQSFYRTILTAARSKKQQEVLSRASIERFWLCRVTTGFPEVESTLISTVFQSMAARPGMLGGRNNGKSDFV